MLVDALVRLVADAADARPEDQPWFVTAGIAVLSILVTGGVIGGARRRNQGTSGESRQESASDDTEAGSPPSLPSTPARPNPTTPDEKLDAARELFVELRTQRDRLVEEIKELEKRHDHQIMALQAGHQREMAQIQTRMRAQDEYIMRLERLLGVPPSRLRTDAPTDPF